MADPVSLELLHRCLRSERTNRIISRTKKLCNYLVRYDNRNIGFTNYYDFRL